MRPENLKHRLSKNGVLRITCKGSRWIEWIGSKYHPIAESEVPDYVRRHCARCDVQDCPNHGGSIHSLRRGGAKQEVLA